MNAYCFVDGAYLRAICNQTGKALPDPHRLATTVAYSGYVQYWGTPKGARQGDSVGLGNIRIGLARVIYYDAEPENPDPLIKEYWQQIELLDDTELGFGVVRGRRQRQKGVDGLIAVDMLEGAFNGVYQIAILVAGDADFVPTVRAVHRRGVMVVVVAQDESLADELKRAADRVWLLDLTVAAGFPPLRRGDNQSWFEDADGTLRLDAA